ncbi:hypothetical protein Tco_1536259, partial [Tanacetum coccineum]
ATNDQMTGALPSDMVKNPNLNVNYTSSVSYARSYPMEGPQSSSNPFNSIETPKSKEPEKALEDEFKDLHLNLPILEVLAHAPKYNAILDNYVESLELGKNGSAFIQREMPKKMKDPGLFILPWKIKLLEDFYVIDMEKDPMCPLLVGRGFLATASTVIGGKKSKIAVGEVITRSIFGVKEIGLDNHVPVEWEIVRDAELNLFKDVLVFRKMVEFLGSIPVNFKGNMWESEDIIDKKIDWDKPPKEGDGAWHIRIEMIDPDG